MPEFKQFLPQFSIQGVKPIGLPGTQVSTQVSSVSFSLGSPQFRSDVNSSNPTLLGSSAINSSQLICRPLCFQPIDFQLSSVPDGGILRFSSQPFGSQEDSVLLNEQGDDVGIECVNRNSGVETECIKNGDYKRAYKGQEDDEFHGVKNDNQLNPDKTEKIDSEKMNSITSDKNEKIVSHSSDKTEKMNSITSDKTEKIDSLRSDCKTEKTDSSEMERILEEQVGTLLSELIQEGQRDLSEWEKNKSLVKTSKQTSQEESERNSEQTSQEESEWKNTNSINENLGIVDTHNNEQDLADIIEEQDETHCLTVLFFFKSKLMQSFECLQRQETESKQEFEPETKVKTSSGEPETKVGIPARGKVSVSEQIFDENHF